SRWNLDPRAPRLAEGLNHLLELRTDDLPARRLVVEQPPDFLGAFPLLRKLLQDLADLELAQAVELGFQNGIGLNGRDLKPGNELGGGVGLAVAGPDDLDGLIEVFENDRETFENVNSLQQVLELEPQPARHDLETKVKELLQNRLQIESAGNGHL